jgi:hypothetical protein
VHSAPPPSPRGPATRGRVGRALRTLGHAIFDESRGGRASEIAAWSNGASALGVAIAVTTLGWDRLPVNAAWAGLVVGALTLAGLRLALVHRFTVWVAAVVGTLTVAAIGGTLAWLLGHLVELAAAPPIAALAGALLAAVAPAWSYANIARRRADDVRDSLVEPISVPRSR